MPALKYPVGYRSQRARELSRSASANGRINPPSANNDNVRPPPKTGWDRAFDLVGGRPALVSPTGAALDLMRDFPQQMDLIREEWASGRQASAIRRALKMARRVAKGRDIRLEIALNLLEEVLRQATMINMVDTGYVTLSSEWSMRTYGVYGSPALYPQIAGKNFRNVSFASGESGVNPNGDPVIDSDLIKTAAPRLPGGFHWSTAVNTPPWSGEYPHEASIVGQAGQNPNSVFRDKVGLWACSNQNTSVARNAHCASWTRPDPGVSTPLEFQPLYAPSVLPRVNPALSVRPRTSARPKADNRRLHPFDARGNRAPGWTRPPDLPKKQKEEGKYSISPSSRRGLLKWAGQITEALDFLDVVFKSTGGKAKDGKTPQDKLNYIWENRHKFDAGKFIYEYSKQQATDAFWGRIGQVSAKGSRAGGFSTGLQTGPWDTEFSYHSNGLRLDYNF